MRIASGRRAGRRPPRGSGSQPGPSRNGVALPADTVEGLAEIYRFRDFAHFVEVWVMTTAALRRADDFRQVVDYAWEAGAHGAYRKLGSTARADLPARLASDPDGR